jgi:xanthine dehydrogenase YagT iron-sulfur-binding subunit
LAERNVVSDLSRRSFIRGSAVTTAGVTMINAAQPMSVQAEDGAGDALLPGSQPVTIRLNVNGVVLTAQVAPSMTLAEVLRGPLGLTGTKIACNRGACSACTVWLDGVPICACMMLTVDVGARNVTTIEGLAQGEKLHPVQQAFIDHDALQCGYCTPGMIMSCAALLRRNPEPNADEVRAAISGHYCRCGTYPHVIAATLAAARRMGDERG